MELALRLNEGICEKWHFVLLDGKWKIVFYSLEANSIFIFCRMPTKFAINYPIWRESFASSDINLGDVSAKPWFHGAREANNIYSLILLSWMLGCNFPCYRKSQFQFTQLNHGWVIVRSFVTPKWRKIENCGCDIRNCNLLTVHIRIEWQIDQLWIRLKWTIKSNANPD